MQEEIPGDTGDSDNNDCGNSHRWYRDNAGNAYVKMYNMNNKKACIQSL